MNLMHPQSQLKWEYANWTKPGKGLKMNAFTRYMTSNNTVYFFGGNNDHHGFHKHTWKFTQITHQNVQFTELADAAIEFQCHYSVTSCSVLIDNTIYLMGIDTNEGDYAEIILFDITKEKYLYSRKIKEHGINHHSVPFMNEPVRKCGIISDGIDNIYIIGGINVAENKVSIVQRYNVANNTWSLMDDLPFTVSHTACIYYDNHNNSMENQYAFIFVFYQDSIYRYDIINHNGWIKMKAKIQKERFCLTAIRAPNNYIYLLGERRVHRYDPINDIYKFDSLELQNRGHGKSVIIYNNLMVIMSNNDVEYANLSNIHLPIIKSTQSPTSMPTSKPTSSPTLKPTNPPTSKPTITTALRTSKPTFSSLEPILFPLTISPTNAGNARTFDAAYIMYGVISIIGIIFILIMIFLMIKKYGRKKKGIELKQHNNGLSNMLSERPTLNYTKPIRFTTPTGGHSIAAMMNNEFGQKSLSEELFEKSEGTLSTEQV